MITPGGNAYDVVDGVVVVSITLGNNVVFDADDLPVVGSRRWCSTRGKNGSFYAVSATGGGRGPGRCVRMHRLILGDLAGVEVDHLNSDGLDNRRSNLRPANRLSNAKNISIKSTNHSGFKGVVRHRDRWAAYITAGRKTSYLGTFDSHVEAALAYDVAAVRLHGEFAKTNKMLGLLPGKGIQ